MLFFVQIEKLIKIIILGDILIFWKTKLFCLSYDKFHKIEVKIYLKMT